MSKEAPPSANDAIRRAIRAARDASNGAITARDAEGVVLFMLPEVTVSVAHGPVLSGREASRDAFAEQFADPAFRGYVREAIEIDVLEPPTRAIERGRWTGRWRRGVREQVMRGRYQAVWQHTGMGWLIRSEVFEPDDA